MRRAGISSSAAADSGRQALRPAPCLADAPPYCRPRFAAPIDLKLDGNEGPPPPAGLLAQLADGSPDVVRRYPDTSALEAILAAELNLPPACVLITAGADDALRRACTAVLSPGQEFLLPEPTFAMLPINARRTGATVVSIPWPEGQFPTDAVLAQAGPKTAAVAVVSPNNPTGAVARAEDLRRLSAELPGALLMVDLAYGEYAQEDLRPVALDLPNAIAVGTLSKAWGLAGLRIGYVAGPEEVISWLQAVGEPYAVAGPSLLLAQAQLRDGRASMQAHVSRVRRERDALLDLLQELGATAEASQANFVLARFTDAAWVRQALAGLGIAVRGFSGPEMSNALRITCPGDEDDFHRLQRALRAVLAPQALLLDLDGVVADVSRSYREAILATARQYAVEVNSDDIGQAKRGGGFNNDWELTRFLICQGGVEVGLEEVKQAFEGLYQGTSRRPGLRKNESLIPSRTALISMAGRRPLAVVTGRPRSDARRFLEDHSLHDLFAEVICLEDAVAKPSPEPVLLALRRLGVTSAWMVGDTVDDIRSARDAGVVPLGVISPADDPEASREALLRAGAARVVTRLEEIEELWP